MPYDIVPQSTEVVRDTKKVAGPSAEQTANWLAAILAFSEKSRLREIERLSALDTESLARLGLTRADIATHVYRDLIAR